MEEDASVEHAAELMRDHRIAALPVTDGGSVEGMFSSREIVASFSRHGGHLANLRVSDLMQRDFVRTSTQESLKACGRS